MRSEPSENDFEGGPLIPCCSKLITEKEILSPIFLSPLILGALTP